MSATRMDHVFEMLKELTPAQRNAVAQCLRAFPGAAPPQASPLNLTKASRHHDVVLEFVEQRCEFGHAVTTDEELFAAFKEWRGPKFDGIAMSQGTLATIICESFSDHVRRWRPRMANGDRPRAVAGTDSFCPS